MAGTGYHPEGHKLKPYEGTSTRLGQRYNWICENCCQVVMDKDADNGDCIDDF